MARTTGAGQRMLTGEASGDEELLTVHAATNGVTWEVFAERVLANVARAKAVVSQQQAYELRLKTLMEHTSLDDAGKMAAREGIRWIVC